MFPLNCVSVFFLQHEQMAPNMEGIYFTFKTGAEEVRRRHSTFVS